MKNGDLIVNVCIFYYMCIWIYPYTHTYFFYADVVFFRHNELHIGRCVGLIVVITNHNHTIRTLKIPAQHPLGCCDTIVTHVDNSG